MVNMQENDIMSSVTKQKIFRFFLMTMSLITAIVISEIVICFTGLDIRSLYSSFYTVEGDYYYDNGQELYRDSKDTERLYELIPDASAVCRMSRHPLDPNRGPCEFHINKFGMRDITGKERSKEKKPGIFRIIILGGSNTFGVSVSNDETYPALLEQKLEKIYPGEFEVWNAGLSAYVLSQKIAYARYLVEEFDPDLLIFQISNEGRRAFFYKAELEYFFERNRELFAENVPLLFIDNDTIVDSHRFLVQHLRTYGLIISLINNMIIHLVDESHVNFTDARRDKMASYYRSYGNIISQRLYDQFIENERTGIILFNVDEDNPLRHDDKIPRIDLDFTAKPREYSAIHPPSYVYAWYAQEIMEELLLRGIIPNRSFENIKK